MIRSLLVLLALLIGIPVLVYYAMQSNAVQTAAVRWLMEQLGQTFGTTIQVGSIDISFFDRVTLEKVLVQDQKKDTLIFIDRLNVRIDSIRMGSKRVHLDEIMVEGAKVHLFQDTTGTNFQFILDSLGRSAPAVKNANTPWEIHFNNLFVRDAGIRFRKPFADTIQHKGIDFNDLDVSKINFSLVHMSHNAAGLTMLLDNASFVEKSGYSVKNLTFKALVDDSGIHASNFAMISPNSRIFCDSMQVVKRKGLIPDGIHPVRKLEDLPLAYQYAYEGDVSESVVSLADAAYFIPDIWGMEEPIIFSGKMRGTVDNLKFKELNFRIGQKTSFNADLELKGLPDWQNTYIFLKFYNNTFNFNDFAKIRLPESSVRPYPNIPKSMLDDVDLTYHGTFSGFPSDFVAYGKLDGELGSLSTDIAISPSLSGSMKFKGLLDAKSFKLGKFIGYDPLGEITLHSEVVLQKNGEKFDATIAGNIDSLYFRNTRIDSIYVNGKASNKSYDGQLTIRDKNLNLSFLGKADLESKTPVFNFSSKVKTANLNLLGLDNLHKEATCSFDMEANFTGKNIDELNGTIDVKKLKLARQDKTFSVNSLVLQTANSAEINTLTFRSDIADANVSGKYKLLEIDLTLRDYLQHYLPSSDLPFRKGTATGINVFNFDLNVKKPEMITFFYLPEMTPNSPIALKGEINSASKSLHLECTAGDLTFRNLKATDIRFTSKGDGKRWQSLLTMHNLAMGGSYQLDDLSLDNTLFNDTLQSTLGWGQAHEKDYTGKIITEGIFSKDKDGMRIADFTMKPSDVVIADTTWHFDKSTIHLDSTRMVLSGFNLHHGDEYLRINGQVSANPDDRLKIHLNKINLGFFDLISKQKIGIEGELSGSTELSNVPNSFFLNSALYIRNFHFEKNHYGDVSFENRWNQEDKRLYSTIMLNRNDTTSLFINGYYTPSTDSLHYRARFQDFHLESIFPFLTSFSNGVSGQANGIVNVTGTFDDPCFLGKVDLTNAKIGVDYTKVTYKFDHFIEFADDTIAFRKITLHDNENNTAILNGYITHKMFGKLKYNIGLKTNKIEVLKTSPADNSLFYGEAHAAGDLLITGAGEKVRLDANIVSQDGTQIYIPMETPAMASDNSFIRFVRKGEPVKPKEAEEETPDNSSFEMNMNITATPAAKIQILFNSTLGDVITGQGTGNLRMVYDKEGNFTMFGDYVIDKGDYLFTLQNMIGKRFKLEEGGTISWNGDPYGANVDLNAVYNLKASVRDLLVDMNKNENTGRVPVVCKINLSKKLFNPTLKFDISFPTVDERTRDELQQFISTQDDVNRQMLALLLIGQFYTPEYIRGRSDSQTNAGNLVGATTSEMLSNQLSNWLSQISSSFDIGFNYKPGDQVNTNQMELALSTQIFDDRVTINGNIGNNSNLQSMNNNSVVGEIELFIKLIKSGKLQLKAYNRSNTDMTYDTAPYKQGLGLSYRESFNSFRDLFRTKNSKKQRQKASSRTAGNQ